MGVNLLEFDNKKSKQHICNIIGIQLVVIKSL